MRRRVRRGSCWGCLRRRREASFHCRFAGRAVLEITERTKLDEVPSLSAKRSRLRKLGYRVALDDLGSGHAGLCSITLIEPDFVKLDMSFVQDVHVSSRKRSLLRSLVRICSRDLDMQVICEGVEVRRRGALLCTVAALQRVPMFRHAPFVLEGAGMSVRQAANVQDALRELADAPVQVVVSDIGMPGEDGFALIRRIRTLPTELRDVPAIALTAFASHDERTRALVAGFSRHIAKPAQPGALVAAVAELVAEGPRERG